MTDSDSARERSRTRPPSGHALQPLRSPDGPTRSRSSRNGNDGDRTASGQSHSADTIFRELFDEAPIAYHELDAEGRITRVNRTELQWLGYTDTEMVGQHIRRFTGENEESERAFHGSLGEREPTHAFEQPYRRKDGSWVVGLVENRVLRDLRGRVIGSRSAIIDITERKRAEEARRLSEDDRRAAYAVLAGVLEAATEYSIIATDPRGLITVFNEGAERMLGYRADDVVGKATPELIHDPEEIATRAAELKISPGLEVFVKQVRSQRADTREWTYVRRDGSRLPVLLTISAMRGSGGELTGFVGIGRDITDEKRAEAALRDSEARVRELFDEGLVPYHELDTDGRMVRVNQAELQLLGYSEADLLGRPIWELVVESDLVEDRVRRQLALYTADVPVERTYRRKDGTLLPVLVTPRTRRDASGRVTGICVTLQDLTERRQAQEALRKSEERYRIVSELTSDFAHAARVLPDGSRVPEWVTQAITAVTGYSSSEIVERRSILSLVHPDDQPRAAAFNARVLAGQPSTEELRLVTKDGQVRWVRLYNRPELDATTGRVVRVYGAGQDITEVRALEQQKDAVLSVVSHDLRNPLAAIKACLAVALQHEPPKSPKLFHQLLVTAASAADRLEGISTDLADLARLQLAHSLTLHRRPTDLVAMVQHLSANQRQLTDRHTIRFESVAPTLVGNWDEPRLERAVENVLSNAIKYSPDGGEVRVSVHREQEGPATWAVLTVRDQGVGIPAEELPYLFTRYFRARNVTGKIPGIGVGLAGAKQTVEQHGGKMTVESHEGVGSSFTIRLPC